MVANQNEPREVSVPVDAQWLTRLIKDATEVAEELTAVAAALRPRAPTFRPHSQAYLEQVSLQMTKASRRLRISVAPFPGGAIRGD